jgi:hypothetical protein
VVTPKTIRPFSILQRKRLTAPNFAELDALEERLLAFIQEWNESAHPFAWTTKSFDKISAVDDPVPVAAPLAIKTRLRPRSLIFRDEAPRREPLAQAFQRAPLRSEPLSQTTASTVDFPIRGP